MKKLFQTLLNSKNLGKTTLKTQSFTDKLYPSGSALARIYGTPKMQKFSSSDSFPKPRPILSPTATFNYNIARFICDLFSPLVPNDYSC